MKTVTRARKPEPCRLCGKPAGEDYSEFRFTTQDGGKLVEVNLGRICRACGDTLDKKEEMLDISDDT